ncbi:BatD family protein [Bergeyella sp. RCAD1439]|uniref:BatD family protein n=1 Tax=Bergeyella anatis TaxID=3113737 RepID=UPI002E185C0E|nr:BatD family protein [Bergeyella sp. RCAD1439]
MIKERLQYVMMVLCSVLGYSQVNIVADTDKKVISGKEQFVLTVIQEVNGSNYLQETPLRSPDLSKFTIVGQGSVRHTYVDPESKTVINRLVYEILLEPKQSGRYKIGSFLVTVNGTIYKSEPFEVVVNGEVAQRSAVEKKTDNVYLTMELKDSEVYQNQPTVAVLRAYSRDFNNLRRVGKVHFPERSNVEIRPVHFSKDEIEQHSNNGWSQVVAMMLVFPNESGKIDIPPMTAVYADEERRGETIRSNAAKLNVKKLPSGKPEHFKEVVGRFDYSVTTDKVSKVEVGKPVDVMLRVKGEGRLRNDQLPRILASEDYVFYKPDVVRRIKSGKDGMKGEVVAHYVVVPKTSGKMTLRTENFSFFDPEKRRYEDLGGRTLVLEVLTSEEISNTRTTMERMADYTNTVLETVNTPVTPTTKYKLSNGEGVRWRTLLGNYGLIFGFFLAVILGITGYRKLKGTGPKTEGVDLGSVDETETQIRKYLSFDAAERLDFVEVQASSPDGFFKTYDEFIGDLEQYVQQRHKTSFETYLLHTKGPRVLEEYRELKQQLQMEKYAPLQNSEHLKELIAGLKGVFEGVF